MTMKPDTQDPRQGSPSLAPPAPAPASNRVLRVNKSTPAARFNLKVLQGLQRRLKENPEMDIAAALGPQYPKKLRQFKSARSSSTRASAPQHSFAEDDTRSGLSTDDLAEVLQPVSLEVETLLGPAGPLSDRIIALLAGSDVLYTGCCAAAVMVFQASKNIVVKVMPNKKAILDEHDALLWLQTHQPDFPVPKSHGVLRNGHYHMLFMSLIPGITLEAAWPRLTQEEKLSIKGQLETLLASIRQVPMPPGTHLGGVQNAGCKDARQDTRFSSKPLYTVQEFEDFIFSGARVASQHYIKFLRSMIPAEASCVFSHGDIRPANIMVMEGEHGDWEVICVIDWESSGWYPEYWDCVKATNNLTSVEKSDWYSFLPDQASPGRYARQWAIDRIWDRSVTGF